MSKRLSGRFNVNMGSVSGDSQAVNENQPIFSNLDSAKKRSIQDIRNAVATSKDYTNDQSGHGQYSASSSIKDTGVSQDTYTRQSVRLDSGEEKADDERDFPIHKYPPRFIGHYDLCLDFPAFPKGGAGSIIDAHLKDDEYDYLRRGEWDFSFYGLQAVNNIISVFGVHRVYIFHSTDFRKLFVLIRGAVKLLKQYAEEEKLYLPLNPERIKAKALLGDAEQGIKSFQLENTESHLCFVNYLDPYHYIWAPYSSAKEFEKFYSWAGAGAKHPFDKSLRIRLIHQLLVKNDIDNNVDEVSLPFLKFAGLINDYFPLHDDDELAVLHSRWYSNNLLDPWMQPFDLIKQYFGERISFYFWLIGLMSLVSFMPGILGVLLQVAIILKKDISIQRYSSGYALIISFWVITVNQIVKNQQPLRAFKWNFLKTKGIGSEYSQHPDVSEFYMRYEFYGEETNSKVTGKKTIYFSNARRIQFYLLSFLLTVSFLVVSMACVLAIYYGKYKLQSKSFLHDEESIEETYRNWRDISQWAFSFVIGTQISIFNALYTKIAELLTDFENHIYDATYRSSFIVKVFLFQSVNTLATFYFTAFGAIHVQKNINSVYNILNDSLHCDDHDQCLYFSAIELATVMCFFITSRYFLGYILPFLQYHRTYYIYGGWIKDLCGFRSSLEECCRYLCEECCGYYDCFNQEEEKEDDEPYLSKRDSVDSHYLDFNDHYEADIEELEMKNTVKSPYRDAASYKRENDERNQKNSIDENDRKFLENNQKQYFERSRKLNDYTEDPNNEQVTGGRDDDWLRETFTREKSACQFNDRFVEDNQRAEFKLDSFDQVKLLSSHYAYTASLFFLVSAFGSLLPASLMLFYTALILEKKRLSWRLMYIYKRVLPEEVENLGCWNWCFDQITVVSVITNGCIVLYTFETFEKVSSTRKLLLLLAYLLVMYLYHLFIQVSLPTKSKIVSVQQERGNFLYQKVFQKVPDDLHDARTTLL